MRVSKLTLSNADFPDLQLGLLWVLAGLLKINEQAPLDFQDLHVVLKYHHVGEGYPDLIVRLPDGKMVVELKAVGGEPPMRLGQT